MPVGADGEVPAGPAEEVLTDHWPPAHAVFLVKKSASQDWNKLARRDLFRAKPREGGVG